jgi:hypothetical protein
MNITATINQLKRFGEVDIVLDGERATVVETHRDGTYTGRYRLCDESGIRFELPSLRQVRIFLRNARISGRV